MPRYPFTPELLDALPEELADLYRGLEAKMLSGICSRLKLAGQLNEVTVDYIRELQAHGISLEEIEAAILRETQIGQDKLTEMLDAVVARNQQYYSETVDIAGLTQPVTYVDQEAIWAIYEQTKGELRNLTQSMGFVVHEGRRWRKLSASEAYQWALNMAAAQVQTGAVSYIEAIQGAVKELAGNGMKTVDFTTGHVDSLDVAVRRAVLTGVNQINQKYRESSMDFLETDLVEVTAHLGARNTGKGFQNHAAWQGKVYRWREKPRASEGRYPDFVETCGLGDVQGIGGANCRHSYWPFIEGVSERTYTDEQLEGMKPENRKKTVFEGREYDDYQATQFQRKIEREIRRQRRLKGAYEAAGLEDAATSSNIRLRRLNKEYKAFSKAAGLKERPERMKVLHQTPDIESKVVRIAQYREPKKVDIPTGSGIINVPEKDNGGATLATVGKIDVDKYKCITPNIMTDEVIITNERIDHIKERHPGDYERFCSYLPLIVSDPDYIIADKRPNTAMVLKEISENGEKFRVALRLVTPNDNLDYKNSILTFLKIREKEWKRLINNKEVLYKKV